MRPLALGARFELSGISESILGVGKSGSYAVCWPGVRLRNIDAPGVITRWQSVWRTLWFGELVDLKGLPRDVIGTPLVGAAATSPVDRR